MTSSTVILKMQFPIETNGKTCKFLQGTLSESCFAGEKKNWEALNVLLIKKKEFLRTI